MTRVMVFGGSGFIGRHVCRTLAAQPLVSEVIQPDRSRVDLVGTGVDELAGVLRAARPDAVVNCAGRLAGTAHELVEVHTAATAKLIDAIALVAPGTRLVRVGSAAEYGVTPPGYPVGEDEPARPVSAYGLSHLSATQLLQLASLAGQVDGVALRVFNPIGAGLPEDSLVGRAAGLLRVAVNRDADHITLGSLSAYRDFIDVLDVAGAVAAAVLLPRQPRQRVLNVARGRAVPARQVVAMLAEAAGFTGEIREHDGTATRPAAIGWIQADLARATQILGWRPLRDLPESVAATWSGGADTG
jgi:nucleoside-diphosphate-sugar epimerase